MDHSVGGIGIEPMTSVLSGQRSTTELAARIVSSSSLSEHAAIINNFYAWATARDPLDRENLTGQVWCAHEGSNLGPLACHASALPLSYGCSFSTLPSFFPVVKTG